MTTTTTPTTTFIQGYTQPPKHPTAADVESYRRDAHEAGLREARDYLAAGSPMLAYLAVVRATQAEFKITGPSSVQLPVFDALRRLPSGRVRKAVA